MNYLKREETECRQKAENEQNWNGNNLRELGNQNAWNKESSFTFPSP
jgi:hypothetical protein